jgi:hypothetical protein
MALIYPDPNDPNGGTIKRAPATRDTAGSVGHRTTAPMAHNEEAVRESQRRAAGKPAAWTVTRERRRQQGRL